MTAATTTMTMNAPVIDAALVDLEPSTTAAVGAKVGFFVVDDCGVVGFGVGFIVGARVATAALISVTSTVMPMLVDALAAKSSDPSA